jgi:hypothetical protein
MCFSASLPIHLYWCLGSNGLVPGAGSPHGVGSFLAQPVAPGALSSHLGALYSAGTLTELNMFVVDLIWCCGVV